MQPKDVTRVVCAILAASLVVASSVCFAAGLYNAPVAAGATGIIYPGSNDQLKALATAYLIAGVISGAAALIRLPARQRRDDARGFPVLPPSGGEPGT